MVFANAAMASRTNLEREMFSWIDREGVIPPGNGPEKDLWDVSLLHQQHASHQPYCPQVVLSAVFSQQWLQSRDDMSTRMSYHGYITAFALPYQCMHQLLTSSQNAAIDLHSIT